MLEKEGKKSIWIFKNSERTLQKFANENGGRYILFNILIFAPWCIGVLNFMEHVYLSQAIALSFKVQEERFHIFEIIVTLMPKEEENLFIYIV